MTEHSDTRAASRAASEHEQRWMVGRHFEWLYWGTRRVPEQGAGSQVIDTKPLDEVLRCVIGTDDQYRAR